ncbi:MAG: ParA family protein [Bryobacterales bacterium]|nr:ParA family protein [Bryobacterales bacterium]
MKVVAFFNARASARKTSLVYHLAWMYAYLDVNVLAADLDPQGNLTSMFIEDHELEPFWPQRGERRTAFGALRPLVEGAGDVSVPYVAEPDLGLGMIVGDPLLATAEEELSSQWPACLDHKPRAFRLLSALPQVLRMGARQIGAQIILVDVGPSLGALNRAAILAADAIVVPLATDIHSLQGLHNLGPTLRRWRKEWRARRDRNPVEDLETPEGSMRSAGYIVMQRAFRLDQPAGAYRRWRDAIPDVYATEVAVEDQPSRQAVNDPDPNCLATLKPYSSLEPLAREARKPMFALKPADGATGGHGVAVRECYRDFKALAETLAQRVGIEVGQL